MTSQDFLVELGTEELPPKSLLTLANAFADGITQGLKEANITFQGSTVFATPRRLAVRIDKLATQQPDSQVEKRGPACKAPTKAVEGFARSCGVSVDQLAVISTDKGDYYQFKSRVKGAPTQQLLPELISQALQQLPIPKRMRWGISREEFVRPVKWLVMLLGDEVVPATLLGLKAGRKTFGHRFHYNQAIELISPAEYEQKLREPGHVLVDINQRREHIRAAVIAEAEKLGGNVEIDPDLLDEVTALNEWPVALSGRFEQRFLQVPPEALILSMKENQKYFHVVDSQGQLMPHFITIANLQSTDPEQVVEGNEKVIRPRLADAAFFYDTDRKRPLATRVDDLKQIIFQNQLGSLYDKTCRIAELAGHIANALGQNESDARRAGQLAKADLLTDMVYEFTDLQGLMGYYYARHDGEPEDVAKAINEQYLPRHAGDQLPETDPGCALAIADRLDTLTGLFGINQPPTGSKDPFALRRAALGVLRIMVERGINLDLHPLIEKSASLHSSLPAAATVVEQVSTFMLERFRAWYEDKGVPIDRYLAVQALQPTNPLDFNQRVLAVDNFAKLPQASALAAANKRVSNILTKQDTQPPATVDKAHLIDPAEQALASQIDNLESTLAPLFASGDYQQALTELATLQPLVDQFFEQVMVMTEDTQLRMNRMALLARLRQLFLRAADISLLHTP